MVGWEVARKGDYFHIFAFLRHFKPLFKVFDTFFRVFDTLEYFSGIFRNIFQAIYQNSDVCTPSFAFNTS